MTKTVAAQTESKVLSDKVVQVDGLNCGKRRKRETMFDQCYPSDVDSEPPSSPITSPCDENEYELSDTCSSDHSVTSNSNSVDAGEADDEPKYLVFKSCLHSLLTYCPSCGSTVTSLRESTCGSMLSVKLFSLSGHETLWNSQPLFNRMPAGNLLTSAAILLSGNTYSRVSPFLNLQFFSHTTFYDIQNKYLFPVVNKAWTEVKREVLQATRDGGPVNLVGDGRSDSPGHSAKYGTYTMMSDEGKVITFSLVQVTEITSSNAMEKEGFQRCFRERTEEGVNVNRIATDRHTSISSVMDKDHQDISHQYDVWHVSKCT